MTPRGALILVSLLVGLGGCGGPAAPATHAPVRPAGHSGPEALMRGVHVRQVVEGRVEVAMPPMQIG